MNAAHARPRIQALRQHRGLRAGILASALMLLPAVGVLTAFGIAPDTSLDPHHRRVVEQALELPQPDAGTPSLQPLHSQERVQRGDSVAALLARMGVRDARSFELLRAAPEVSPLFRQLRPGRALQAVVQPSGELQELRYFLAPDKYLHIERSGQGYRAQERSYQEYGQRHFKTAVIRSSLFAATDEAGIPDSIAIQIARIFSTDIDFHIDLRKGDRLSVVYELVHADGEHIRPGDVLYAEFVNDGRRYEAFRFQSPDGDVAYYSRDGQSRAKSFMRSPLEFSRVSSGFGTRFHPIFKNWRAHTGTDFAAPRGTRVWATADGTVEFVGTRGGYGKCIEIRHSGGITTLYGHLSGFAAGLSKGKRVRQGEVVGFVGSTGYATGPHLHYEFKISGIHHDPLRVALPKAAPLPASLKAAFDGVASQGEEALAALRAASSARFD